jgi:hypothetical protein
MVQSPFTKSILLSALGEGLSWRRHPCNHKGHLHPLNSPRARRMWLLVKKYARRREHFRWEHYIFGECIDSSHGEFFKKKLHIFEFKLFPWSTYTHTMYMFKIGSILSLFAIFNNFTSFFVFVSYMSDMNGKCIKSYSKFVRTTVVMFMRHL